MKQSFLVKTVKTKLCVLARFIFKIKHFACVLYLYKTSESVELTKQR